MQIKSNTEKLKKLKNEILEKTSDDTRTISVLDSSFRINKSKEKFRIWIDKESGLNIIPVDFVSKAIVHLCCQKDSLTRYKAYHLVNPNEFFFNSLFVTAKRLGYKIDSAPYSEWKKSLFESEDVSTNALYPMLTHFTDDYDVKMKAIRPWYDNTNTLDGLADSGIFCPATIDLLGTYFGFLVQCGFMELPKDISSFAIKKQFFESYIQRKERKEEEKVDYKNLMRRNRIDSFGSTDDLSGY